MNSNNGLFKSLVFENLGCVLILLRFWLKMCVFLFMLLSAATTMVLLKMMLRMSRLWSASMSHPIRPLRKNLCNKKAIPSGLVSTWDANKRIHKHFKNLLCSQGTFMRCLPIHNFFTVA